MDESRATAVILAAGQGKRMQSDVHKQYLLIQDKPVLYYSLKTFEESPVDDIILVVGKGEEDFCRKEILERYGSAKVRAIVEGGKERYHSVANGIRAIRWRCDHVFIHDGARPFVDLDTIRRAYDEVRLSRACAVGMPVKDTIKIVDADGYVAATPDRSRVWQVQTPQVFARDVIAAAYERLLEEEQRSGQAAAVTDDAMVVEHFMQIPVRLVKGSYANIKITTPEDLRTAAAFLEATCPEPAQTGGFPGGQKNLEKI